MHTFCYFHFSGSYEIQYCNQAFASEQKCARHYELKKNGCQKVMSNPVFWISGSSSSNRNPVNQSCKHQSLEDKTTLGNGGILVDQRGQQFAS